MRAAVGFPASAGKPDLLGRCNPQEDPGYPKKSAWGTTDRRRASLRPWPRCWSSTTPPPRPCATLTDGRAGRARDDAIEGVEVVVRAALRGQRRRRARRRRHPAGHHRELRLHVRRPQALLRHRCSSRWAARCADTGRPRRAERRAEAVRPLRARALRHHRRGAVGARDRRRAALAQAAPRARGARRGDAEPTRSGLRARRYDRGTAERSEPSHRRPGRPRGCTCCSVPVRRLRPAHAPSARTTLAAAVATALLALSGCGGGNQGTQRRPRPGGLLDPPEVGACRSAHAGDVAQPSNASATVPCVRAAHRRDLRGRRPAPALSRTRPTTDPSLGTFAYQTCAPGVHGVPRRRREPGRCAPS